MINRRVRVVLNEVLIKADMFEKTSQITKATLAALWLTISGHGAHAQDVPPDQSAPQIGEQAQKPDESEAAELESFLAQGRADDVETFIANDQCDNELVDTLVSRDVYEEALSLRYTTRGERPEDPDGTALRADMQAFRADRQEKIDYFFGCSAENVNLHAMAKRLQDNPRDRDAFERIFSEMVTERADAISSLYTHEEQVEISGNILDILEQRNAEYIDSLGFYYNADAMREQVQERLQAEHGRIAVMAAHADMIDVLDLEAVVPAAERSAYRRTLSGIVENEFRDYTADAGRRFNSSAGQGFDI